MFVPFLTADIKPSDDSKKISQMLLNFLIQLTQNMQQSLSNEGFLIPSMSSSDMAIIQTNALPGTLIFVTDVVNGGASDAPNGQLFVRLNDGIFHPVTNT